MKSRPILFSAPMIRAIFAGKTQTRRPVKPTPAWGTPGQCCSITTEGRQGPLDYGLWAHEGDSADGDARRCPYGAPSDQLWVREAFRIEQRGDRRTGKIFDQVVYRADSRMRPEFDPLRYKPSIYMPRAASRIALTVTDVRVERLQDIADDDCLAEGVYKHGQRWEVEGLIATPLGPRDADRALWDSINGNGSWNLNPWVWAVSFKRVAATAERAA